MTFELTEKETQAALIFVKSCLDEMGGKRPSDLEEDPFTWVALEDLLGTFSRFQAAGIMSSLGAKGVIYEHEENEWALAEAAWRWLDTIWDA